MWKEILMRIPIRLYIKLGLPLLFTSVFNVFISFLFQIGINAIVNQTRMAPVASVGITLILAAILYVPIYYYQRLQMEKIKLYVSESFAEEIFKKMMTNSSNLSKDLKEGQVINLVHEDINNVALFFDHGLFPLFSLIVTLIAGTLYVFAQSIAIGTIFIVAGSIFAIINRRMSKDMRGNYSDYVQLDDNYKDLLEQFYYLVPLMRFFNLERWVSHKHRQSYEGRGKSYLSYWKKYTNTYAVTEGGIVVFEAFILIVGLYFVMQADLNLGSLIGAWNAGLGSILYPLATLPIIYSYYARYLSSVQRIWGNTTSPKSIANSESSLSQNLDNGTDDTLYIHDLTLSYSSERDVLTNFNAKIPSTGIHYIVGPSGSGKTTFVKALLGLVPIRSGKIINKMGESMIGHNMAYVPQIIHLFNVSLRDNLTLGNDKLSDSVIINACKSAQIWEKIQALPDQLDTVVGEDITFSRGETRRIGIARALLSDKSIIVMDEPYSDLDFSTQEILFKQFQQIAQNKSLLIVSHELKFIADADSIIKIGD